MSNPAVHRLSMALGAFAHRAGVWRRPGVIDLAFALTLVTWVTYICLPADWRHGVWGDTRPGLQDLALQASLLGAEACLLLAAGQWRPHARWVWGAHSALTLLWMLCSGMDGWGGLAHAALMAGNIGIVAALLLLLGGHAWRQGSGRTWALLLVAVPICAVLLIDLSRLALDASYPSRFQPVVGLELVLLWLALPCLSVDAGAAPGDDERRRQLAQDLHDGVGAHLTSLVVALEHGTPAQRDTAAALHECLLELKLLVDGAHTQDSVVAHLANLRYRMQPLLDLAGIAMHWHLVPSESLERLQGDSAAQVLRIAQEALANVVRHSGASAVTLRCTTVAAPPAWLLEICDNGRGLPLPPGAPTGGAEVARPQGRGLAGMRARAARLGGTLRIDGAPGAGTCVRLQVPIAAGLTDPTWR